MLVFLVLSHRVYGVIAPGDTIHVIGKFDGQGKCDVNRDQNYIIVHPEVLVSGTRVLFLLLIIIQIMCLCFTIGSTGCDLGIM